MKSRKWCITFYENGNEYTGSLIVTAKELHCDESNNKIFWADGVHIEIDEPIISVEELVMQTNSAEQPT